MTKGFTFSLLPGVVSLPGFLFGKITHLSGLRLAFMINGVHWFSPSMRLSALHAPEDECPLCTTMVMCNSSGCQILLCHFALDNSCASTHDVHRIPDSQRDVSWVDIAIWISGLLLCCVAVLRPLKLKLFQVPVQDKPSAHQVSSELTRNFVTCSIQIEASCLAHTPYLYHHGPQAPDIRSLSLILLWRCLGRGCLLWNSSFTGSRCVRTPSSPLLRKSYTWSVLDNVMFHCIIFLVTMALASILFCRKILLLHKLGS